MTGLVGAAEHNGKRAMVQSFAEDKGRYTVRLLDDDDERRIRVKPENVVPVVFYRGGDGSAVEL